MLAKILKVKPQMIDTYLVQKESQRDLPWNIFQDFTREHLHDKDGIVAFALAIYELVIFLGMFGYIKMAMVDAFEQIQHGNNPSLTILAQIFRSLSYYRRNKEKCSLGCAPLLYFWIRSHILCEWIIFMKPFFSKAFLIIEFCKNVWPEPKTKEWWVSNFQNSDGEQLQWMAPWISRPPILYHCGSQSWVPFIGPWGMISYTLLLALRQFRAKQFFQLLSS